MNESVASTVGYEFKMLKFLHAVIEKRKADKVGTGSDPEEDALLESFLLHARVLRDFFFKKRETVPRTKTCPKCKERYEVPPPVNDDVLAGDFLPGWSETESDYLKSLNRPLNKLLAHLTASREECTIHRYLWEPGLIYGDIGPVIERFMKALPKDRQDWFTR